MTTGVKQSRQAITWQIEGLDSNPPPLTMLINPSNIDFTYAPLINETRTMGGFFQEFWGEQLTSLSASGQTGMFYHDSKGITNRDAVDSEAYMKFVKLLNIYKNNGKEYAFSANDQERKSKASKANPNKLAGLGTVVMVYMNKEYEGRFDGFTYKEMADKPYYLEYDFTFKVIRTIGDIIVQSGAYIRERANG